MSLRYRLRIEAWVEKPNEKVKEGGTLLRVGAKMAVSLDSFLIGLRLSIGGAHHSLSSDLSLLKPQLQV